MDVLVGREEKTQNIAFNRRCGLSIQDFAEQRKIDEFVVVPVQFVQDKMACDNFETFFVFD